MSNRQKTEFKLSQVNVLGSRRKKASLWGAMWSNGKGEGAKDNENLETFRN